MEGQKAWNNILLGIKSSVSASTFKTWFWGSFVMDFKERSPKKLLVIGLKNNFLKEQVETRYQQLITKVARRKGLGNVEVVFVVAEKENGARALKNEPIFSGQPLNLVVNNRTSQDLNPNHTFGNFIVGASNNLAFLAAKQVADNLGSSYNPLVFWGPTGVGKTHLLQAVGNEVLAKTVDSRVLYATAEKFTNDYIESLYNKTTPAFRAKYRNVDLLLVDDIQFLSGKESTQDEFFHTFNELYLSGRQAVFACDRHPKELVKLKDRLLSRFLGGMMADINLPDLEMKMAILKSKCKERNIDLGDEVVLYLAENCQGGARELEGNLISVLALMKLSGKKLVLGEVEEVIKKNGEAVRAEITPGKLTNAVCRHFKLNYRELSGSSRRATLVFARQVLMYLLRTDVNLPLEQIGQILGNRDHSTVIYGIEKIERLIASDQIARDEVLRIKLAVSK